MLVPFGIRSGTVRFSDGQTAKGYYRNDFSDAWARYLPPPEKRHTVTKQVKALESCENGVSASVTAILCDAGQNEENPSVYAGCDGVTDLSP